VWALDRVAREPVTVINLSLAGAENSVVGSGIAIVASVGNERPRAAPRFGSL
jgi:hypothetical protein